MLKATGIVRRVDDLGRVVIPKELIRTLGFSDNQPIEIFVNGTDIVLRKYAPGCTFCDIVEGDLTKFRDKLICIKCRKLISV